MKTFGDKRSYSEVKLFLGHIAPSKVLSWTVLPEIAYGHQMNPLSEWLVLPCLASCTVNKERSKLQLALGYLIFPGQKLKLEWRAD